MTNRKKLILTALAIPLLVMLAGLGFALSILGTGPYNIEKIKVMMKEDFYFIYEPLRETIINAGNENHSKVTITQNIPQFKIKFSRNDIAHFNDLTKKLQDPNYGVSYYSENNVWRGAKLEFNGIKYKIKVKSHGKEPDGHTEGRFISLRVKLQKGELIFGQNVFSLLVRKRIEKKYLQSVDFSEFLGVLTMPEKLVRVTINSWEDKYFYFEPKFNNKYLESQGLSSLKRYERLSETAIETDKSLIPLIKGDNYSTSDLTKYLTETLIVEGASENSLSQIINNYLQINELVQQNTGQNLNKFFDLDYIAKFEAVRLSMGHIGHGAMKGNSFIYFNQANGNFYPSITRDHVPDFLKDFPNQAIEKQLNHWEPSFLENTDFIFPLYQNFTRNDYIRQKKYRHIAEIIDLFPTQIEHRQIKLKKTQDDIFDYGWANPVINRIDRYRSNILKANLGVLNNYLSKSSPTIAIQKGLGDLILLINPNSMSALGFKTLTVSGLPSSQKITITLKLVMINGDKIMSEAPVTHSFTVAMDGTLNITPLIKDIEMFTGVDENSDIVKRQYVLSITAKEFDFSNVAVGPLVMENRIMGADIIDLIISTDPTIEIPDTSKAVLHNPSTLTGMVAFKALKRQFPSVKMTAVDGKLTIHKGSYKIQKDFMIPRDMKLNIEAGTTLLLGENTALMGYQGVDINGTADNPVTISALDPAKPYGTVGFLGDEKSTTSHISYLNQSNGNERWVNDVYFSGGFSIHYHQSITMKNSIIQGNHADDGVNFKNTENVIIDKTIFQDNYADQIDLDYTKALVTNSQFLNTKGGDLNGDGLDISGSQVVVKNTSFTGFNDKGISVGENSNILVLNSSMHDNKNGSAVKDRSYAYFIDVDFKGNTYDIASYMKKRIFGGANVFLDRLEKANGVLAFNFDKKSELFVLSQRPANDILNLAKQTSGFDALFTALGNISNQKINVPATYVEEE